MPVALLDICDSNLQLWCGEEPLRSPGYALLDGGQYIFGNPARSAARLRPRDINTRFWWQLNTEPLLPALGPARHSADLVHAHLLEIHRQADGPEEVLLAVSGSMQRDQLALLLGIIQQCPFEAVGLVNRSVALGSLYGVAGRLFHLELQLHQAVLSELLRETDRLQLQRTTPLPGCGVLQLQERLVEIIAAAFIRQTRFDPRRKADTEQRLYDALPDALRALDTAVHVDVEVNGYRARIEREQLLEAGRRLFSGVDEAIDGHRQGDRVLLDPIAGLLPGIRQYLQGCEVAPVDALWRAVSAHGDQLVQREQALNFITALPCLAPAVDTPGDRTVETAVAADPPGAVPAAGGEDGAPTHILRATRALPLERAGTALGEDCELYARGQLWLMRGSGALRARVNGGNYQPGQVLGAGDRIETADGASATLIEVLP